MTCDRTTKRTFFTGYKEKLQLSYWIDCFNIQGILQPYIHSIPNQLIPFSNKTLTSTQHSIAVASIHPKSGSPGSPDSANYLNFPQNYSLRTRKLPTLLCWILSQGAKAVKMCQSVVDYAINVWQTCSWFQTHFSATFLGLFNDLRTFVARFWCRDLRTFSANFSWLKNTLRKLVRL